MNNLVKKKLISFCLFLFFFTLFLSAKNICFFPMDSERCFSLGRDDVRASSVLSSYFENPDPADIQIKLDLPSQELFLFVEALKVISRSLNVPLRLLEQFDSLNFIFMNAMLVIAKQYNFLQIIPLFRVIPIRFLTQDDSALDVDRRIFLTSPVIIKTLKSGVEGEAGIHIIKHNFRNETIARFVDVFSSLDQVRMKLNHLNWRDLTDLLNLLDYYNINLGYDYNKYILDLIADKLESQDVLDEFLSNPRLFRGSLLEAVKLKNTFLVSKLLGNFKKLHQTIDSSSGGHDGPVYSLFMRPNGCFFISGGEVSTELTLTNSINPLNKAGLNTVKLWKLVENNKFILCQVLGYDNFDQRESVYSVAASSDKSTIAAGDLEGYMQIGKRDNHGNFVFEQLLSSTALVSSIVLSSDGNCLVSGSWDSKVKIWTRDVANPNFKLKQELSFNPRLNVSFSRNGHTSLVNSVVMTLDGNRIFSASSDKTIKIWDKNATGDFVIFQALGLTLGGHLDAVNSIVVSAKGSLLVSASSDNTIKIWRKNLAGLFALQQTLDLGVGGHTDSVKSVVMTSDGKILFSGANDGTIKMWKRNFNGNFYLQQTLDSTVGGHMDFVNCLATSSNGSLIVSGSTDSTIKVWFTIGFGNLSLTQAMFIFICFKKHAFGQILDLSIVSNKIELISIFNSLNPEIKKFLLNRYVKLPL